MIAGVDNPPVGCRGVSHTPQPVPGCRIIRLLRGVCRAYAIRPYRYPATVNHSPLQVPGRRGGTL